MKNKIDKSSIISMAGVGIALFALIIIFSQNTVFGFLTTAIIFPFGFVGFWILLPFIFILGLYMLLKQKLVKFKVGLSLWGLLVIIFSLLILTSAWASKTLLPESELEFGNISDYIVEMKSINTPYDTKIGGGFIGFFLAGCLFSAITGIGTQIVCWILIVIGLCLVFHNQLRKLFNAISKNKGERKVRKEEPVIEQSNAEVSYYDPNSEIEPVNEPVIQNNVQPQPSIFESDDTGDLEIRNFNNTHTLRKARFSFEEEVDDSLPIASMSTNAPLSAPSFGDNVAEPVQPSLYEEESYDEPIEDEDFGPEFGIDNEINDVPEQEESIPAAPVSAPIVDEKEEVIPEAPVDKLNRPQPKANPIKNYIYPPTSLLDYHESSDDAEKNAASTQSTTDLINQIFEHLHVGAKAVGATVGPAVTRYDIQTNSDVSVNQVAKYVKDISIRLGGVPARFEEIVVGKATSGLEIPNAVRTTVGLRESIENLPSGPKNLRYIPFGKNISGELLSGNLTDFPHMLVSGTTGSGKTIFMHSVILSLIMRNRPDELKIVLIDPKKVEMAYYEKIPHLLCPNISQSNRAYVAMKKLVDEMERRYNLFAANRVRDIKGFNEFAKANNIQPLPYIVVFVDEYADLVEEVKEIKQPVVRIAQKARAAGIHLVIATQRPSVNVIDGVIKANVSVRVALMVASQVDSISIINQAGAESLLGNGDMIVDCSLISRSIKPRVQGCFVDVPEINRVCDFLRDHYKEDYDPEFLDLEEHDDAPQSGEDVDIGVIDKDMAEEELYNLIKENIVEREYCSISYIQRTYAVGFPKAGRLFNKLIQDGYVARGGDARGSKVLIRGKNDEQQMGTIEQSTFIPDEPSENEVD